MPALNEWICKLHPSGSVAAKTLFVAASVVAVYKLSGHVLREYIIIPKTTILKDIDILHTARRDGKIPGRALICGGSIAGLLAAAVCADHFESVMIIEAEAWANEHGTELPRTEERAYRTTPGGYQTVTAPRARIIQYYFGNLFQPTVYSTFTRLFPCVPGIIDELNIGSTVGVPKMKLAYGDANLEDPYTDDDIKAGAPISPCLTREATEIVLRKAVKKTHPNVIFKTGTVHGLLREGDSLTGVTIRADGAKADIKANFVVDATGPTQMSYTKWFQNAGVPTPPDLRVQYDPILRYTVSIWTIPTHLHSKWPVPGGFQCGPLSLKNCDIEAGESQVLAFVVAENNQLLVNFGGPCVSDLPHSLPELREYTKNIYGDRKPPDWISPLLDFMEEYEEECKPFWVDIRVPPMSWVQWHKTAKNGTLPKNWIAVGDANMNLNPLYGQGIFKSCVDVTTLDTVLRSIPASCMELPNIPQLFYKRQNPRVSSLWDSSRANDYGWPTTIPVAGEDLSCNSWIRKYGRSCIMLAREDPHVLMVWWHVAMQLAPGTDLFAPWIALKVARYQLLGW